jgi:hypothetical protein
VTAGPEQASTALLIDHLLRAGGSGGWRLPARRGGTSRDQLPR